MVNKQSSPHFCFVILHYIDKDTTINCITSIKECFEGEYYSVVILDNGSPNDSGNYLAKYYESEKNIKVIIAKENLGFAKGNNIGYIYAKKELQVDYIVMINNDIQFLDKKFLVNVENIYKKEQCYLLGPDIVTPSELHQSPLRSYPYDLKTVNKKIVIKTVFLYYFKLKKFLHLENRVNILEDMYDKRDAITQNQRAWKREIQNPVLQGACIIYTPNYIKNEDKAFFSDTFMYGEEDLLAYYCKIMNYNTLYSPQIQVLHLNGETTKKVYKNTLDKSIFNYTYYLKGLKILRKKMKMKSKDIFL